MEDGWELRVLIADLQVTRRIRVRGDTHIGGVMLRLVEAIGVKADWSDHGLWWPEQNRWLLKTRHTLDQSGVQSDAMLEFHRMHNCIRVQLPDLQEREVRVDFSQSVFGVVVGVCKDLGVRHPEELSMRLAPPRPAVVSNGTLGRFGSFRRSKGPKASPSRTEAGNNNNNNNGSYNPLMPRQTSQTGSLSPRSLGPMASPVSINSLAFEGAELTGLANSPYVSARDAFTDKGLARPKSLAERAALNESWLDSSRSLMEQGVRPSGGGWSDVGIQLRYKFHAFYDLNIKYDSVRINQIYEQVKWSLLSEELECTEEEMLLLAALQLQIHLTSGEAATVAADRGDSTLGRSHRLDERDEGVGEKVADDEIDAALAELEESLMSDACLSLGSPNRLSSEYHGQQHQHQHQQQSPGLSKSQMPEQMPELTGFLKFFKPRKYTLRGYKRYYFVLRETRLAMFQDRGRTRALEEFNLVSAEMTPDVNASTRRFGIRLFVPSEAESGFGQMQEVWLRCDTKDQYAEWSAAICLAARGKTLASRAAYEAEVKATSAQLDLQAPRPQPQLTLDSAPDIDPADYVSSRHLKGHKSSWLLQRILELHANVRDRSLIEAKLDYIKVCQRLPMYGVAYFTVQCSEGQGAGRPKSFDEFRKEKQGRAAKEELIGVAPNRLMLLEAGSGQIINTWRYEELQSWTVNWEVLSLQISLVRPPHAIVLVPCPSSVSAGGMQSLCKTLAEFIGGNVFLSLRQPEKNQELSEHMFHKLTGSRDPNVYR